MKTYLIAAAASLVMAPAFSAAAEPKPPEAKVAYGDLDLHEAAGATAMLDRLRHAAARVCRASAFTNGTGINSIERFDACYRQSVRRAVSELDAPRVTAAFEARSAGRKLARLP